MDAFCCPTCNSPSPDQQPIMGPECYDPFHLPAQEERSELDDHLLQAIDEADQFKPAADEVARTMQAEPTDRKELEQQIADCLGTIDSSTNDIRAARSELVLLFAELGTLP